MCFTISNTNNNSKKIENASGASYPLSIGQINIRYVASGFTYPEWPIAVAGNNPTFQFSNWGLIPFWTPQASLALQFRANNLNARAETIFEKKSFAKAIKTNRCIIPVTGFFEWRQIGKKKYPYRIFLKEQELFFLGGISDEWTDKETGEIINTFSIITTEANSLMAKIHNTKQRMPLILHPDKIGEWMQPDLSDAAVKNAMQPLDVTLMDAYTISKRIISRTDNPDSPESLMPFIYPEIELYDN